MSAPIYMIRPTPAGSSRDTFATYRMRQATGAAPADPSASETWARMPIAARQWLAVGALGSRGLDVVGKAWADIEPRDRLRIGSEARRIAARLS